MRAAASVLFIRRHRRRLFFSSSLSLSLSPASGRGRLPQALQSTTSAGPSGGLAAPVFVFSFGDREGQTRETSFFFDQLNSDAPRLSRWFFPFLFPISPPLWKRKTLPCGNKRRGPGIEHSMQRRLEVAAAIERGSAQRESAMRGAPQERRKALQSIKLGFRFSLVLVLAFFILSPFTAYPYLGDALGRHRRKGEKKEEEDKEGRKRRRRELVSVLFYFPSD